MGDRFLDQRCSFIFRKFAEGEHHLDCAPATGELVVRAARESRPDFPGVIPDRRCFIAHRRDAIPGQVAGQPFNRRIQKSGGHAQVKQRSAKIPLEAIHRAAGRTGAADLPGFYESVPEQILAGFLNPRLFFNGSP